MAFHSTGARLENVLEPLDFYLALGITGRLACCERRVKSLSQQYRNVLSRVTFHMEVENLESKLASIEVM